MKKNININNFGRKIILLFLFLPALHIRANNLRITDPSLAPVNDISNSIYIRFNISWENSFRLGSGTERWDAAWVFVKYRVAIASGGDGIWRHIRLNSNPAVAPSGCSIDVVNEGAFIYRSIPGAGTFSVQEIKFYWNYSSHLKSTGGKYVGKDDAIEIQLFGIEMVYVPGNQFFRVGGIAGTNAFQVTGINTSDASATGTGYPAGVANNNADFPNGYKAFYSMKYEISQQQYVDFLNTLTYPQQLTRTALSPASASGTGALVNPNNYRNGIDVKTPGVAATKPAEYACNLDNDKIFGETNDGQWIACGFLSWGDLTAYLDWSGLRPMTELEFEKACKGNSASADAEYAWGNTSLLGATSIKNPGTADETYGNAGANVCFNNSTGVKGPLRVGSFAVGSKGRATSGATYYGIMEMSGNLWERIVTAGINPVFTGKHGDGELSSDGNANADLWPGVNGQNAGFRGGSWLFIATGMRIEDRVSAAYFSGGRDKDNGGRGVRYAP